MKPAVFLVLVLAAASVQAAPLDPVGFRHAAAEYDGTLSLGGGLVALVQREDPNQATMSAAWTLEAEHVHVERDEALAPDTGAVAIQPQPTTTTDDYHAAHAEGHPRTGGYSLGLFPLPDAHAPLLNVTTDCLRAMADAQGNEQADRVVGGTNREPATARVGDAMRLLPCISSAWSVNVTGDFLLVLYDWHTLIHDENGEHNWTSGTVYERPVPEAPVEGKRMMQTYMTVRNATLTLTTPEPERLAAYTTAIAGDVAGAAKFLDAQGQDGRGRLDVEGTFTVNSRRIQDHAHTYLTGNLEAASFNDQVLPFTTRSAPVPTGSLPFLALLMATAAVLITSALLAVLVLRGRPHGDSDKAAEQAAAAFMEAERLRRRGRHRHALRRCRTATRLDPTNPLAWMLRGHCHYARGHLRRAIRAYDLAYLVLNDDCAPAATQASVAYKLARLHARRRRADQSAFWLRIAGRHNPALLEEAQREPDFDIVRGTDLFPNRARRGAANL